MMGQTKQCNWTKPLCEVNIFMSEWKLGTKIEGCDQQPNKHGVLSFG